MPDIFSLDFPQLTYWLAGGSLVSAALFLTLFLGKLKRVSKRAVTDGRLTMPSDDKFPTVSVVVYDDARATNLEELLPLLLEQDYPAPMEVIVVNDGGRMATEEVIARLETRYPNLYMTFLPEKSRALSRRKLAVTLGVKAARYEMVMCIGGNSLIDSPLWLKSMMRHATRGKEVVIGWAFDAPMHPEETKPLSRLGAFDTVYGAVQYIAWGAARHPWRGNAGNLAFSRSLFFSTNGFAETLNLVRGDDDIWVNSVANAENTAVELSPESMVTMMEADVRASHRHDKLSHTFTSRKIGRMPRFTFALASFFWIAGLGCGIAAIVVGYPSIWPLVAECVIALGITLPLMVRWNRASKILRQRPLFITVPWFFTVHPFYNAFYKIKGFLRRKDNLVFKI